MVPNCFFIRLPPPAALLVLAAVLRLSSAHVLPRELPPRESRSLPMPTLSARPSPLAATPAPTRPARLRERDSYNTVCGYIGGNPALPATCTEGSHCAVDVQHGVMGCCPDGHECTRGIFTGCVDKNSSPQTLRDPYVFTCQGGDVCYRNSFDGGFYQYGCGSASHLATDVASTAPGRDPLDVSHVTLALTATPTPLATPVVIGTLSSSASGAKSDPGQASSLSPAVPSAAAEAGAPPKDARSPNTAAIVGGTIGGVAALVLLLGLCIMLFRRKRGHGRGPGQDTRYISPMADARHHFEPLPSSQSAGPETGAMRHRPLGSSNLAAAPDSDNSAAPQPKFLSDGAPPNGAGKPRGPPRDLELDQVPLTRGVDGLSPGVRTTRAASPENDNATLATDDSASSYRGPRRSGGGALWQQNRRQRRNLMWI
ncbi:hypothetical protein HRG_001986 [Hirsutella rhossiliensis]|uniref:Mid2 domain-containing protein n=1 Tax=Hirsutella rhossiliensis TaxID=111463 RepID=A0A9P8N4Q0_9HYPO|nr:uncharacterized protein HRG_01986 [Hirsutella rhossiliensis]KAH0966577.1 hypothetical protein HRG_01986 [Hirsutella rhossiliensis]